MLNGMVFTNMFTWICIIWEPRKLGLQYFEEHVRFILPNVYLLPKTVLHIWGCKYDNKLEWLDILMFL